MIYDTHVARSGVCLIGDNIDWPNVRLFDLVVKINAHSIVLVEFLSLE